MAERHTTQVYHATRKPTVVPKSAVAAEAARTAGNRPASASARTIGSAVPPVKSGRVEVGRGSASAPSAAVQLAETSKALQALRQARDGVMERAAGLAEKLRVANDRIDDLTDARELALLERDGALERLHTAHAENRELREKLEAAARAQEVADQRGPARQEVSSAVLAKSQALVLAAKERERQVNERQKATVANLIEQFGDERRTVTAELEELKTKSAVQIAALRAQLAAHARDSVSAAEAERQRLELANLRVELDAVREELTRARLSEAERRSQEAPEAVVAPELAVDVVCRDPKSRVVEDLGLELVPMDWFLSEIEKDFAHLEALDVLASLFRDSSERALSAGCLSVHRLAAACADVAGWLRKAPGKLAAGIPLMREGRALIKRLLESGAAMKIPDPTGAKVYAVDNDCDNCECIVMALDKAAFHTRYATKPDVAFGDLAKGSVDLIILDVDLGDTDGFDLHDLIRQIDYHRETPVIFLSGLLSTADRLAGLSGPPASFVAKPYNLNELVLKALCTILTSRLSTELAQAA